MCTLVSMSFVQVVTCRKKKNMPSTNSLTNSTGCHEIRVHYMSVDQV